MLHPCAWAIEPSTSIPQPPNCGIDSGYSSSGVCGIPTSLKDLAPTCAGPGADIFMSWQEACHVGLGELEQGIRWAAHNDSVAFDPSTPLLSLSNPDETRADLSKWYYLYWLLAIVYVPVPLCLFVVVGNYNGGYRDGAFAREKIFPAEETPYLRIN
eukprot:gnl/MRDRNA2_/MRDRNA2_44528_c0_seq2.p1 gnl/MRDRNA2_/MRDRNA2_44528_c0~~gnl/MRDRNA2_/MRDRNA2_44528_c0_seq2.p1  ORF type:complete len:157 (-),score=8.25 gnl/MRDRNA2_/MRDRNA2_44528_c0_seq2:31-501(-)